MVDLKKTNTENQANNKGMVRPPFRRPYHPPQNQGPPNTNEGLISEEIYSILPYQHKLRKMHPSMDPSLKKGIDKLLTTRIIFPVTHTQ